MPSSRKACHAMLEAVENSTPGPIVDLGSGWGTLVIAFAKKYPQRQVIGYELSLIPWLVSLMLKYIMGMENLSLYRRDFLKADLSDVSVILCYLFPRGMCSLKEKLEREQGRVSLIASNTFALPSCQAEKVLRLDDLYRTPIYLYRPSCEHRPKEKQA